ncbi:hypothetical protein MYCTH_2132825 [Thermothelomyces thermophilus ATCC 42464]|uniref:NECAP PHear domain-containing protein n=1 Tax=Thermothelomyces thermophilus (strain ATCC 42464 / BCRC 31852 / DSM 1799) TaxID=573729 RepID=G2Q5R9_THET4|nr:uncharacterized protein MYCTH_2132825 [Thermothelomyces thermophilus ATCC 42464]AEO55505.1 hypothetical protein MYCTH_2132825 [Thermothelomyces thermophilus ATCC 42464]
MDPSATIDPATGRPLPPDAIVRILHITPKVHVYSIPRDAVATAAGYAAASWTADPRNPIFTARLRVLETSFTTSCSSSSPETKGGGEEEEEQEGELQIKVDILLEDPSTGSLFAAAPYTTPAAVEPTTDSSRFFAVRVQDPSGKQKATLGVGFEERSEAFDFGVALQEATRALGRSQPGSSSGCGRQGAAGGKSGSGGGGAKAGAGAAEEKRDLSLKEGETITVNLAGTRFAGRRAARSESQGGKKKEEEGEEPQSLSAFALPPPPPPSAREVRAQKRLIPECQSAYTMLHSHDVLRQLRPNRVTHPLFQAKQWNVLFRLCLSHRATTTTTTTTTMCCLSAI